METDSSNVTIFISYSWANTDIADQVEKDLSQLQIILKRDVRDLHYKSDLRNFMLQVRETDFAIILISKEYLRSKNCMIEVLHLLKERDFEDKILPIIIGTPDIYNPEGRLEYTKHWEEEIRNLETLISIHSPELVVNEISELKTIGSIHSEINEFLTYISNINNISFEKLKAEGYKSLLEKIGFKNVTHLVDLLIISYMANSNQKEILLDEWFERNTPTSDAYSIRAGISRSKGNIERAELNYQKALSVGENNHVAKNNYAFLLMCLKRDYDKARKMLEEAIEHSPYLTEARLNLGVLLSNEYKDNAGAEQQYKEVIKFNPTDPRAYNNMTTVLMEKYLAGEDVAEEICRYYERALKLKPDYIEAKLGYSNFLSEFMGNFTKANQQLDEIVKIDSEAQSLVSTLKQRIESLIAKKITSLNPERNDKGPCGSGIKFKKCHGK